MNEEFDKTHYQSSVLKSEIARLKENVDGFQTGKSLLEQTQVEEMKIQTRKTARQLFEEKKQTTADFSLAGAKVLQLGLDEAGKEMKRALEEAGSIVKTFDAFSIESDFESEFEINVSDFDLICATRWFSPQSILLQRAKDAKILIFSQLQLAQKLRAISSKTHQNVNWIGVAGTNGKSVVVKLIELILEAAGFTIKVAEEENLISVAKDADLDFAIFELTSYNLNYSYTAQFSTSVLLNISSADTSWHGSFENYAKSLKTVYENTETTCVFNVDDRAVDLAVQDAEVVEGARAVGFTHHAPGRGQLGYTAQILADRAFYDDPTDPLRFLSASEVLNLDQLPNLLQKNDHVPSFMMQNIAAAVAVARTYGVSTEEIVAGLKKYEMPERMNELVWRRMMNEETKNGVGKIDYIDDTNSQTPSATESVIKAYPQKSVLWIGGGDRNEIDYSLFADRISVHIASAIIIGDNDKLFETLKKDAPSVPSYRITSENSQEAIKLAIEKANEIGFENQTVLLSPGCELARFEYGTAGVSAAFCAEIQALKEKCRHSGIINGVISE